LTVSYLNWGSTLKLWKSTNWISILQNQKWSPKPPFQTQ